MTMDEPSTESGASLENLRKRSKLLRRLREFFYTREFLEVETPTLSREVIPELHIEPFQTATGEFLQASPELPMKRLLASGARAIFQVAHSFRAGERGRLHNPEFTIVEWYRVGDNMQTGIDLIDELARELLDSPPAVQTSYADAFQRYAGICPHTASESDLANAVTSSASPPRGGADMPGNDDSIGRDELLNLLLATQIEPELGRDRPEIIYHYPASQASLARTVLSSSGHEVAERFELYYRGIELANGFHELTDAAEQRRRFEAVNAARVADGRPALPIPESLLAALEAGLPDCTGCALGFDRLVMLAAGATSIDEVRA